MPQYVDDPPEVLERVRAICARLPEVQEDESVNGRWWRIRRRTFAWLWTRADDDGAETEWGEVAELVTESYCVLAPKRLARSVRPPTA